MGVRRMLGVFSPPAPNYFQSPPYVNITLIVEQYVDGTRLVRHAHADIFPLVSSPREYIYIYITIFSGRPYRSFRALKRHN